SGANWQPPEVWGSTSPVMCRASRWSSGRFAPEERNMPTGGDDPFRPSNATILRPKPGAGKRIPAAAPPPAPPPSSPPRRPPPSYTAESLADPTLQRAPGGQGLNPLVTAAVPLLLMVGGMRSSTIRGDVPALRRQALEEIRRFEENARNAGIANEVII